MPDTAIPIFQTVNEKGEATLEVEAKIKALGLILQEEIGFTERNEINWEHLGTVFQSIVGRANPGRTGHFLALQAGNALGSFSDLLLEADEAGHAGITATANDKVHGVRENRKLIDSEGKSSFLQIVGEFSNAQKWSCNFGISLLTFAASVNSNVLTLSHGLGVAPACILGLINQPPIGGLTLWSGSFTTTTVLFAAQSPAALNGTVAFSWLAIG